jgi:hypothetical protein
MLLMVAIIVHRPLSAPSVVELRLGVSVSLLTACILTIQLVISHTFAWVHPISESTSYD